jgi:hypothetical protein
MSEKQKSWTWLFVMVSLFLGAVGLEAWNYLTFDRRVPAVFDRVEVINSPIEAGDVLMVRIWRDKVRDDCTVHSHRLAVTQDGVSYDLPDAVWAGGQSGTAFLDYGYPTLAAMPPGPYELRVHLSYSCPGITFEIPQPTALFRVRPEGGSCTRNSGICRPT